MERLLRIRGHLIDGYRLHNKGDARDCCGAVSQEAARTGTSTGTSLEPGQLQRPKLAESGPAAFGRPHNRSGRSNRQA